MGGGGGSRNFEGKHLADYLLLQQSNKKKKYFILLFF